MADEPPAMRAVQRDGALVLAFSGRLDASGAGALWDETLRAVRGKAVPGKVGDRLEFDVGGLTLCDTAGATLLLAAERAHGGEARISGADAHVAALLARVRKAAVEPKPPARLPVISWGQAIRAGLRTASEGLVFLGEMTFAIVQVPSRLRMFRRVDLLRTADQAGVQALPLVLLLGVLIGLILAFQSLIPMRRFGADLYVANLVAISLIRELGPLLVAVILAGRSGSAFAAEIGTMKVSQEIDALTTMGIDPMTMLVLPRMLAAVLMAPVLTIVMDLAGLLGMSLVLVGGGIPLVAIGNQVAAWVTASDLYGGLGKAAVFGAAVAGIGCRAGLGTGVGPRAVGASATAAVVGGIVAAIVLDGMFALVFFQLGW